MASSIQESATPDLLPPPAPPGPFAEFWGYFAQNRGALIGLTLVVLLCLCAIFADVISPHPPNEQYRDATLTPPAWVEGDEAEFVRLLERLMARRKRVEGLLELTVGARRQTFPAWR